MTGSPAWRAVLVAAGAAAGWSAWRVALKASAGTARWSRTNFRGREVSLAGGPAAVVALLLGLAAHLVIAAAESAGGTFSDGRRIVAATLVVVVAAGAAGVHDDLYGDPGAKGFRGHLGELRHGRVTSGLVKLVVIAVSSAVAAVVLGSGRTGGQQLLDAGVIAGCANLTNLLDLRPGRALKALVVVVIPVVVLAGAAVAVVTAWTAGVAIGLLPADLRERAMLGDGGANALGASAGVALAATGGLGVSAGILGLVVVATAVSEFVSFSRVIEACPPLRWADRTGRLP